MPVPAGGGDDPLVLFTLPELDLWTPGTAITEGSWALYLELVTTAIRGVVGADRYDALTDLAPLKLIALNLAKPMARNAEGKRSTSRQIDDYTETDTYATETLDPPVVTDDIVEQIWAALGVRRGGAFTIRPAGVPAAVRSWC